MEVFALRGSGPDFRMSSLWLPRCLVKESAVLAARRLAEFW